MTNDKEASKSAVTTDERAAFLTWWCADVPEYMREKWKESVDECLRNSNATDKLVGAWEGFQYALTLARAAPPHATVAQPGNASRVEQLRKGLFEARDAMRVMSNWVKQSDPAGHIWAVRMVDRANAVLSHAPTSAVVLDDERAALTPDDLLLWHRSQQREYSALSDRQSKAPAAFFDARCFRDGAAFHAAAAALLEALDASPQPVARTEFHICGECDRQFKTGDSSQPASGQSSEPVRKTYAGIMAEELGYQPATAPHISQKALSRHKRLSEAVFLVLSEFTLPPNVRKVLETAYYG